MTEMYSLIIQHLNVSYYRIVICFHLEEDTYLMNYQAGQHIVLNVVIVCVSPLNH
jgi:hypothetical protein